MKKLLLLASIGFCLSSIAEERNDWENEAVTSINRENARAYSFPLENEKAALTEEEVKTPYMKLLNGSWKYNWRGTPVQRPLQKEEWTINLEPVEGKKSSSWFWK